MTTWKQAAQRAICSGTAAALFSAAMLALCGKIEGRSSAGPLNGPSQWIWGHSAAHRRRPTLRHTLIGYLIHHAASIGWAIPHEKYITGRLKRPSNSHRLLAGAATAAFACAVDFRVARGRLQPGFDKQLSRKSLALVYAAFGLGLAFSCRRRKHEGFL
jgi:hypothetical protein